jgi:LacI family transcriptional regulator, purine nucleotide synthesis repressor
MSITIKDIAKIAKVSHTTVSRALNNSPFINEDTKSKIIEIANEYNYVPNYNAKSLVLQKSYNIGLFFSTIGNGTSPSFFHKTVSGINSIIHEKYTLLVRGVDDYKELTTIDSKRFDGIILMSQRDSDDPFIKTVMEKKIPLVVLNREINEPSIINILTADQKGSYNAVRYLIENGHRDIAIIEGKRGFKSTIDRKEGFLRALLEEKIDIKNEYIISGNYDTESGYEAMKKLLEMSKTPTAVFCSNDDMAVGAMKAVYEEGLRVPEDISIVGFDDSDFCKYVTPALTTVKKPVKEVSRIGAEKLIGIIEHKESKGEKIYIPTKLVVRESVSKVL